MRDMEDSTKFDEDEDIHICGSCGTQFNDVAFFITHKKHNCPVRLARQQSEALGRIKLEPRASGEVGAIETVQPLVENLQSAFETESNQYIETTVSDKDGETLDYLQVTEGQTGTQVSTATNSQYVTQSEYASSENQAVNNDITHEYVLLSGPASEEPYSDQDQTFNSHTSTETVYTLDSQTLQNGLETVTNQPITTERGETYYQSSLPDSQPITVQSDIDSQTVSNVLQLNSVNNTLLVESGHHIDLERDITDTDSDENQSNIPVSVPVQDGFVTSSDQNSEVQYTLSLDVEGRARNIQVSRLKVSDIISSSYTSATQASTQGMQGLKVSNIVKSNYGHDIQYTLSTEPQNPAQTEETIVIEPNFDAKPQSTAETKLKSVKASQIKKTTSPEKRPKTQPEKKFKCSYLECKYKTAYLKDLERHHRIHTGEKPFKCVRCEKSFNRNDKLVLHMRYHLNDRAFKCQLCDYSAVENGSLKKHMKMHMDERPYSCQVCPYKSRSASQLQIHLRTHTGDTPYSCGYCKSVFKVSSDLTRHMRIHTGVKPFKCEFSDCTYRCAIKSNLRSHYKTHHKVDQELCCDSCDFKSSSKKALFEHKKTHNVKVDLTCDTCNYQCSNRSALKNHLKKHGSEEKYNCNYCDYKSLQIGNIQAHIKRKHPSKVTRKAGRKSKLIDKSESKKVDDLTEERPIRGNIRTKCQQNFKCDRCSAAFVREDSLKCHLKQHKDSSLSTAYAVLKLQQPVINTSTTQSMTDGANIISDGLYLPNQTRSASLVQTEQQKEQFLFQEGSFQTHSQAPTIPNQTVNLGINDILMAAGVSSLHSSASSPTSKRQLGQFPIQDLSQADNVNTTASVLSPTSQEVQNVFLGHSSHEVPSVQVMQNVSLPYIRLPNGQVLILTGQNSLGQLVTQSENLASSDLTTISEPTQLQTHIFAQQPTAEQQQLIQSPADSTSSCIAPQISAPQQPGAIPIQIILPNGSQQALPLVSQLLNSVMNRGTCEQQPSTSAGQILNSASFSRSPSAAGVQNFVLQIPSQSGAAKDSDGSLAESQQFVLQISGQGNLG